ncbi:MAG: hypothetical protein HOC79_07835 [Euryarchaeota archaeon]|jgi:NOL1/NOP2/fmu family ribosome biogenesis protein|nr:hypothetical protein [Euryarchaeota archaeon]MBT4407763.1 hypothetical protein [Euryarchaeota archaeon]
MNESETHDEGFVMELCSGKAAWQIEPSKKVEINIDTVSEKIQNAGYGVKIKTRMCHILHKEDVKITLFPSGKILVKCEEKEKAIEIAKQHLQEWLIGE